MQYNSGTVESSSEGDPYLLLYSKNQILPMLFFNNFFFVPVKYSEGEIGF